VKRTPDSEPRWFWFEPTRAEAARDRRYFADVESAWTQGAANDPATVHRRRFLRAVLLRLVIGISVLVLIAAAGYITFFGLKGSSGRTASQVTAGQALACRLQRHC
jgi:hypothetical protein